MALATLQTEIELENAQFNRDAQSSKDLLGSLISDTSKLAAGAGAFLVGVGAGLGQASGALKTAGDEALRVRKNLSGTFDGLELEKLTQQVLDLGATPPFTEAQFTRLAKSLQTFEKDVSSNLVRVANAAVETGQPFQTLSDAVSRFSVDPRATIQLEKLLNISTDDLVNAGAVLDEVSGKLSFVGDNAGKAQAALETILDDRFEGAAEKVVTATDKLNGELTRLKQEAGAGLSDLFEDVSESLLPLVKNVRELSGELGPVPGLLLLAGAGITSIAGVGLLAAAGISQIAVNVAALGGVTAIVGSIGTAFTALSATAIPGVALALGALPLATITAGLVLLGKTANDVINDLEFQSAKTEELLTIENERIANARRLLDIVGLTTEELKKQGVTSKEVVASIFSLQEQIEQAEEVGNDALVERLKAQVVVLQQQKRELAEIETDARQATEKATAERIAFNSPEAKKAREADAAEKKKDAERDKARQEKIDAENLAAEQDRIALLLAQEKISLEKSLELRAAALEKFRAGEEKKRALAIETARVIQAAANQADADNDAEIEAKRKKRLSDELARIKLRSVAGTQSAAQEAAALQTVLNTFELTENEKQRLIQQTAQVRKKASDERQKQSDEAIKQAEKEASDLARLQSEARGLEIGEIDRNISRLQKEADEKGTDTSAPLKQAFQDRLALQVEQIRLDGEAAAKAADNADQRAQIELNTQAKIRDAYRDTAEEFKAAVDQQLSDQERLEGKVNEPQFDVGFDISELSDRLAKEQATTIRSQVEDSGIESPELETIEQELRVSLGEVTAKSPALTAAITDLTNTLPQLVTSTAPVQSKAEVVQSVAAAQKVTISGTVFVDVSTPPGVSADVKESIAVNGAGSDFEVLARGVRGGRRTG